MAKSNYRYQVISINKIDKFMELRKDIKTTVEDDGKYTVELQRFSK